MRLLPGPAGRGGYRRLEPRPGEIHVWRDDLAPSAVPRRGRLGVPVLVLAQLSDTHVMDHQSPARAEQLDRYADLDLTSDPSVSVGCYRPQEPFTTHVVDAMVRSVNSCAAGPVSGAPVDLAVVTGDVTDNCQSNEARNAMALFGGGQATPDSGSPERYEGVAESGDARYWHPGGEIADLPRTNHGFPTLPGVLDAARRPFRCLGLGIPWFSVHGNHDSHVQGTLPATGTLSHVGTGRWKLVTPAADLDPLDVLTRLTHGDAAVLARLAAGRGQQVTPDPERRHATREEWVGLHLRAGGSPIGHGYTARNLVEETAYYAFDAGPRVRCIVLDTVNEHGGWQGSLDRNQLAWLSAELARSAGRLVVLMSHHPLETLVNDREPDGERRVLADELVALLLAHPCVVLWLNGHVHEHRVTPVRRTDGTGGFWQVTTASHIDWPQQSRIVELLEADDGAITVACTVLDTAAPVRPTNAGTPLALASLSRELSANCWQSRAAIVAGGAGAGGRGDRNVLLAVPPPARRASAGGPCIGTAADVLRCSHECPNPLRPHPAGPHPAGPHPAGIVTASCLGCSFRAC